MSTGGNVPTQGFVVSEATTEKKRGDRGKLGKGTPGSRLKSAWRAEGSRTSLRDYARKLDSADAKTWFASKRPGGTDEQRKARKEARKERAARNAAAKAAKKANSGPKKAKKKSVSGGGDD